MGSNPHLKSKKNIYVILFSNTVLDPLKNHKATSKIFVIGPLRVKWTTVNMAYSCNSCDISLMNSGHSQVNLIFYLC